MNLLVEQLPDAVLINGHEVAIRPDYRSCIRTILAFEDDDLTAIEKQMILIENLYPEPPDDLREATRQAVRFLNSGAETSEDEEDGPRLYSFEKDAGLIFAAFRQTHGIDLETAEMHWWKFLALFMDLGADTTFCNLVSLRKRLKNGTATKEERAAARDMEDLIDLPELDRRTLEERDREDEFMRLLEEGRENAES